MFRLIMYSLVPPVIEIFRYQELFYNQQPGQNALRFADVRLYEMQEENYRRIEYKLKNRMYIRFTAEVIEQLRNKVNESIYEQARSKNNGHYSNYNKDKLKSAFDYLYSSNRDFFRHQEPAETDLSEKSVFENGLDAGRIMWKLGNYIDFKDVSPKIDRDLEDRYFAAKREYIKFVPN